MTARPRSAPGGGDSRTPRHAGATAARDHRRGEALAVQRILVDGRNVQRAMARAGGLSELPTHVFIAQLRAAVPPDATLELILDGYPSGGVTGHVGPRFEVAYSRHRTADRTIADRVEAAAEQLGPVGIDGVLVVSDDREVGDQARRHGARVVGTAWLTDRIRIGTSRASAAGRSIGAGRPRSR